MTLYRLAHSPKDYAACHALMRTKGETAELSFPTILAERDGELIGFLSTRPAKKAIIAGPLFLVDGLPRPIWVVIRLITAYDRVLNVAGVQSYLFRVDAHNRGWRRILDRMGLEPYSEDETGADYLRRVA